MAFGKHMRQTHGVIVGQRSSRAQDHKPGQQAAADNIKMVFHVDSPVVIFSAQNETP